MNSFTIYTFLYVKNTKIPLSYLETIEHNFSSNIIYPNYEFLYFLYPKKLTPPNNPNVKKTLNNFESSLFSVVVLPLESFLRFFYSCFSYSIPPKI